MTEKAKPEVAQEVEQDEKEEQLDLPLEFMCWTMVALAPFLYWVNGPPVSTDQAVVQTVLVSGALLGGITLRFIKIVRRMRGG